MRTHSTRRAAAAALLALGAAALLTPAQRKALMRLAVFRGGWTLAEALPVAGADLLLLRELAEKQGTPAYLIDGAEDIRDEWLEGVEAVGVTAGASLGLRRRPHPFVLLRTPPTPYAAADALGFLALMSFSVTSNVLRLRLFTPTIASISGRDSSSFPC